MIVRQIEKDERFDAYLISANCFHIKIDDLEKEREKQEQETEQDWGAFTEEGTLAARIINNDLRFLIDGSVVKGGGIGFVSTKPEYRNKGAIREIFLKLLPEAYRSGEVISALYPFNHAFYRKQGYETITFRNQYELSPALLSGYRFDGEVIRWNPGDSVEEYLNLYQLFIRKFNLSLPRDRKGMQKHIHTENPYLERKFTYLFRKEGKNLGYVTFTDVPDKPAPLLKVEECIWGCREGFYAILSFLGRFDADYNKIQIMLPSGIDLLRLIQTPRAYEIKKECQFNFMVRVINVPRLLKIIKKPADCDFVIKVQDEIIKENNGNWRVTADTVTHLEDDVVPDLNVSERALSQMAVGGINIDEAMLRTDVEVFGKEELLRRVFTEKCIFVGEAF